MSVLTSHTLNAGMALPVVIAMTGMFGFIAQVVATLAAGAAFVLYVIQIYDRVKNNKRD